MTSINQLEILNKLCAPLDSTTSGKILGATPVVSLIALKAIMHLTVTWNLDDRSKISSALFDAQTSPLLKFGLMGSLCSSPLTLSLISKLGAERISQKHIQVAIKYLPGIVRIAAAGATTLGIIQAIRKHSFSKLIFPLEKLKPTSKWQEWWPSAVISLLSNMPLRLGLIASTLSSGPCVAAMAKSIGMSIDHSHTIRIALSRRRAQLILKHAPMAGRLFALAMIALGIYKEIYADTVAQKDIKSYPTYSWIRDTKVGNVSALTFIGAISLATSPVMRALGALMSAKNLQSLQAFFPSFRGLVSK